MPRCFQSDLTAFVAGSTIAVAALALLPHVANAQEPARAERSTKSSTRSSTQSTLRSSGQASADSRVQLQSVRNGRSIDVEMANGEVVRVTRDGEPVGPDRVRMTPDGIEILDESGEVLERLEVGFDPPGLGTPPASMSGGGVAESRIRVGAGVAARAPKSMMGVGLGEIDASLAAHLEVDARKVTMLTNVADDMPAAKAGLRRYDVITSVDGSAEASPAALRLALRELEPGTRVKLGYRRCGVEAVAEVEVVAFDPEKLAMIEGFEMAMPGVSVPGMSEPGVPTPPGAASGDPAIERWMRSGADEADDTEIFFFGPDGRRREIRIPRMPGVPREMPFDAEGLERAMRELRRGLEEMSERLERGPREERRFPERERATSGEDRRASEMEERLRRLEERIERMTGPGDRRGEDARGESPRQRFPSAPSDEELRRMPIGELRELLTSIARARSEANASTEEAMRLQEDFARVLGALRKRDS